MERSFLCINISSFVARDFATIEKYQLNQSNEDPQSQDKKKYSGIRN
jgi:hypothetical protein